MSSILTAASALRNHQVFMDVIANNVANMNTVGFKSSTTLFQDMISRTMSPGARPAEPRGGTNPTQVGLGMRLGSINTNMQQGILQSTGRREDLAITGSGFFIYRDGLQQVYSRDGSLGMDAQGDLVNQGTGMRIQGWTADDQGVIDTATAIGPITVPIAPMSARATDEIDLAGSLNAALDVGSEVGTNLSFYDSLGTLHIVDLTFTKTATNTWEASLESSVPELTLGELFSSSLQFNENGQLVAPENGQLVFPGALTNGAFDVEITLDIGNMTQLESTNATQVYVTGQNGRAAGEMIDFIISDLGEVVAVYSNGLRKNLGQIAIAEFLNPAGLTKMGQNSYGESGNSGEPQVVQAGNRSVMNAGFLEMSNVNLTLEFSEMIRAQRGFQANSRVVTSSDEMIQELVNLVR